MIEDKIYEEKASFPLAKFLTALEIAIAGLFLSLLIYQLAVGPIGERPAPDWVYLIMFVVFCVTSVLVAQIRRLNITATYQMLTVAFGRFRYTISWDNITSYRLDENPGIKYGGWGIRIAKVDGKWTLVYDAVGCPRIMLKLRRCRFSQFAFSTRNPEKMLSVMAERLGYNANQ